MCEVRVFGVQPAHVLPHMADTCMASDQNPAAKFDVLTIYHMAKR